MQPIQRNGNLYLGKIINVQTNTPEKPLLYDPKNLTTHAVCVGMTGSGKTGLGITLLEEAGLAGVPALIIDPKGDLGDLLLTFPDLSPEEFLPWVDTSEAERNKESPEKYADTIASTWKEGLAKWGMGIEQIKQLKDSVEMAIYTPASEAGISLSILNSFAAPSAEFMLDPGAVRERVLSTTSSLLGLLGIDADPIKSREHILISTILERAWHEKESIDLSTLIQRIQTPPFSKVGVFDTETFFPTKERLSLSMKLNNLLASPGFQAWIEGEPLDIQNLLYGKEGKPQFAILSIAHLTDSERMFFVTLLLNELLVWMRRQTGTSGLRALLYMDEIFGYFPPSAMPPSKMPMLTLLKQARAFGIGIILATQNPVDLDYKGLSNCGTWLIGKLQTERDKSRVIEGLNAASNSNFNKVVMDKMIAACGNRNFILRSVHLPEPVLFQTRWTMSYLRGPLTLPQIHMLRSETTERESLTAINPMKTEERIKQKPFVPTGIQEYYVPPKNVSSFVLYKPKILGLAKLHFVDAKSKVDLWQVKARAASFSEENCKILWEEGEDVTSVVTYFEKKVPENASFEDLPSGLLQAKNYVLFSKSFAEFLYQNQTFDLFEAKDAKILSQKDESEKDFRNRVASFLGQKMEGEVKKIRDKYRSKLTTLQEKIQRSQVKVETSKSQAFRQKMDTFISVGTTLLGAFFGKGVSKGTLSQAGTSIRKVGRVSKDQEQATHSEDSLETLQQQQKSIQIQMDKDIADLLSTVNPDKICIEKTPIRPRKSDISIEDISIVWTP